MNVLDTHAAVDFDAPDSFRSIRTAIPDAKHPLHYVALPPDVFEKVAANLANIGSRGSSHPGRVNPAHSPCAIT